MSHCRFITFSLAGRHATIDGKKCLNFGTYNFLGFLEKKRIHVSDYKQFECMMSNLTLVSIRM